MYELITIRSYSEGGRLGPEGGFGLIDVRIYARLMLVQL